MVTLSSLFLLTALAMLTCTSLVGQGEDIDLFLEGMMVRPVYPLINEQVEINVTAFSDTNGTNFTVIEVYEGPAGGGGEELIYRADLDNVNSKGLNVQFPYTWSEENQGERNLRAVIDVDDNVTETNEFNNELNLTVLVSTERFPELTFDIANPILIDPSDPNVENPLVNDTIIIQIAFANMGRAPADTFKVQVLEIFGNQTPVQLNLSQFNGVGEEQVLNLLMNWTPDRAGDYHIRVILDLDDEAAEYLEDNNLLEEPVTILPHLPRLSIDENAEIALTPLDDWLVGQSPYARHNFSLTAYVISQDPEAQARNVRVDFYDHHQTSNQTFFIGTRTILLLDAAPAGGPQPETVTIIWGTLQGTLLQGDHTIEIVIDPINVIGEYNENDNRYDQTFRLKPPRPDLVALSLEPAGEPELKPAEGIYTPLNLTLANLGSMDLFETLIKVDDYGEFTYLNVTLLEGDVKTITFDHYWVRSGLRPITIVVDPYNDIDEIDENNTFFANDYLTVHVRVVDFSVAAITHNPTIFEDEPLEVKVYIQNHQARVEDIEIELLLDSVPALTKRIEVLDYRKNLSRTFILDNPQGIGLHNLTVRALFNSIVNDTNESNNYGNSSFIIKPNSYQLRVYPFDFTNTKFYVNETFTFEITVVNYGELPVTSVNLMVLMDTDLLSVGEVGPVPPNNGEFVYTLDWIPDRAGDFNLTVMVDTNNTVEESNEDDNAHTAPLRVRNIPPAKPVQTPEQVSILEKPTFWFTLLIVIIVLVIVGILTYRLKNPRVGVWDPSKTRKTDISARTPGVPVSSSSRPTPLTPPATRGSSMVCLECLKVVTIDPVKCSCGKIYHGACAKGSGRCHACGENLH